MAFYAARCAMRVREDENPILHNARTLSFGLRLPPFPAPENPQ